MLAYVRAHDTESCKVINIIVIIELFSRKEFAGVENFLLLRFYFAYSAILITFALNRFPLLTEGIKREFGENPKQYSLL